MYLAGAWPFAIPARNDGSGGGAVSAVAKGREETMSTHSSSMDSSDARHRVIGRQHVQKMLTARPARVIVTPVDPPLYHPLSKRDVQRVLSVLPPESTAGLRSVSLLGDMWTVDGYPVLVTYRRKGFIRLHAVPTNTWSIGPLRANQVADLLRYGARVEAGPNETRITWTPAALRLYTTVCALMPGVSRHRREHEGQMEPGNLVRALDVNTEPWLVSDLALRQWATFLQETAQNPGSVQAEA